MDTIALTFSEVKGKIPIKDLTVESLKKLLPI